MGSSNTTRKALVTGGAGFIGSHLCRRLLQEGWVVDVLDNLSTGFRGNIPEGAGFVFGDVSKDEFLNLLPRDDYDAIFHLAAQSSGEISFEDPSYDLKTNCHSTLLLLSWSLQHGIRRFIYTSSMSVYGDQDSQPVKEEFTPKPKSFYGVGKLASESYVNIYSHMGLETTSLRLFNVYGPGQNMENLKQGMVSIYMAYILKGQEIIVKGSPDRYRDFVYIDDVIECYMRCLAHPSAYGKTYNVGSGVKTTVRDLVRAELLAFGHDPDRYPIRYESNTPGDTFGIYADITKIRNEVGWTAETSLEAGLSRMSQWALSLLPQP